MHISFFAKVPKNLLICVNYKRTNWTTSWKQIWSLFEAHAKSNVTPFLLPTLSLTFGLFCQLESLANWRIYIKSRAGFNVSDLNTLSP